MWLVVGIENDGRLSNHNEQWAKTSEEALSQQLNQKLDPFQACTSIRCENINNSWVVILELNNPGTVVKWDKVAYKAIGTTSEKMDPDEIMTMTIQLP